jgi:hypothetical protein
VGAVGRDLAWHDPTTATGRLNRKQTTVATKDLTVRLIGEDRTGKALNSAGGRFDGIAKKMAVFGAAAAAGLGVAGKHLFEVGKELQLMDTKSRTVFGDQLPLVQKWAKEHANAMGLTSREATGLAGNFADLLVPMGFTRAQAAGMSTDVVGLSGALAEWSGGQKTAAEVSEVLAKSMLGERDGLKALGISISDADVKARLLANGQDKLTGSALEQAKAQATQQLIMEKSTDAQAAFAAGGGTLSRRQDELTAKFRDMRDDLAVKLLPAFTKVGEFIADKLVPWMSDLAQWFQRNSDVLLPLAALFGTFATLIGAVTLAAKTYTAVQAALNVVMAMNPLGLVIVALAGLAAGLVVAYQKSETFRDIVDKAFQVVKTSAGDAVGFMIEGFKALLTVWLTVADGIVSGAATALGWIPGLGDKLKAANTAFDDMKGGILRTLDDAAQKAYGFGENSGKNVAKGLDGSKGKANAAADRLQSSVGLSLRAMERTAERSGANAGQGLANGLDSKAGSVAAAAQRLAAVAGRAMASGLQERSPSKVTRQIGAYAGQGLALGLLDELRRVNLASSQLAGAAVPDAADLAGMRLGGTGYINHRLSATRGSVETAPRVVNYNVTVTGTIDNRITEETIIKTIRRAELLANRTGAPWP